MRVSRGTNLPAFRIDGEMLFEFVGMVTGVAGTGLGADAGTLLLTAGTAASSGVDLKLCGVETSTMSLDAADLQASAPLGASVTVRAKGALNGVAAQPLGEVTATRTAAGIAFTADLTGLGSATKRVVIRDGNGTIVASASGQTGTLVVGPSWPDWIATPGSRPAGYRLALPAPVALTLPGIATTVVGESIEILSENPTRVVGLLDDASIRFAGTPRLRLLDVTGRPALLADRLSASVAASAVTQTLDLAADPARAGQLYVVAASINGTSGFPYLGWNIPLANPQVLQVGFLDANGGAAASFSLGNLPAALVGLTVHQAIGIVDWSGSLQLVTNPVSLTLTQ